MILGSGLIQAAGWTPTWLIRDEFTDTRAAGSVDGTAATPGPGTRAVVDTGSKLSVGSGVVTFATGGAGFGNPGLWYGALARSVGLAIFGQTQAAGSQDYLVGFDTNQTGAPADSAAYAHPSLDLTALVAGVEVRTTPYISGDKYILGVVLRSSGSLFLARHESGEWELFWVSINPANATFYPTAVCSVAANLALDYLRVAQLPAPFDGDDGLATDTHSGSVAAGTTFGHEADCLIEYTLTTRPSADNADVLFRVQDASNYWICRVNSSGDISLVEVVAGTPTTRGTAAGVVSSGHRVVIIADGTTVRLYSNNTLRVTYASASSGATATAGEVDALGTGGVVSDVKSWPCTLSGTAAAILDKVSA